MGRTTGNDGGLANNASAPQYDPVSGGYRDTTPKEAQQFGGQAQGQNPFLRLLQGGLGGLGQGLQNQASQQQQMNNRSFYGY